MFRLVISSVEWKDVDALAKFAQAGIAYDAHTAYVGQVFVYLFLQPADLLKDANTRAAFAALDRLAADAPRDGNDVVLRLSKAQMRQMLMMLGMAAEAEDQAEIVNDGHKFHHRFPDIDLSPRHYAAAFQTLLDALWRS